MIEGLVLAAALCAPQAANSTVSGDFSPEFHAQSAPAAAATAPAPAQPAAPADSTVSSSFSSDFLSSDDDMFGVMPGSDQDSVLQPSAATAAASAAGPASATTGTTAVGAPSAMAAGFLTPSPSQPVPPADPH